MPILSVQRHWRNPLRACVGFMASISSGRLMIRVYRCPDQPSITRNWCHVTVILREDDQNKNENNEVRRRSNGSNVLEKSWKLDHFLTQNLFWFASLHPFSALLSSVRVSLWLYEIVCATLFESKCQHKQYFVTTDNLLFESFVVKYWFINAVLTGG